MMQGLNLLWQTLQNQQNQLPGFTLLGPLAAASSGRLSAPPPAGAGLLSLPPPPGAGLLVLKDGVAEKATKEEGSLSGQQQPGETDAVVAAGDNDGEAVTIPLAINFVCTSISIRARAPCNSFDVNLNSIYIYICRFLFRARSVKSFFIKYYK